MCRGLVQYYHEPPNAACTQLNRCRGVGAPAVPQDRRDPRRLEEVSLWTGLARLKDPCHGFEARNVLSITAAPLHSNNMLAAACNVGSHWIGGNLGARHRSIEPHRRKSLWHRTWLVRPLHPRRRHPCSDRRGFCEGVLPMYVLIPHSSNAVCFLDTTTQVDYCAYDQQSSAKFHPPIATQLNSWRSLRDALNVTNRTIYTYFCPRSFGGSVVPPVGPVAIAIAMSSGVVLMHAMRARLRMNRMAETTACPTNAVLSMGLPGNGQAPCARLLRTQSSPSITTLVTSGAAR
jgi:hypothetical protein